MSIKRPSLSFLITFGWALILFNIRMAIPACVFSLFAWKIVSNLLLWGSVCLCHWGMYPVCCKMLGPVYVSSLLVYVFWGKLSSLMLRDIKENNCYFLLFLLLEVELCLCGYLTFCSKIAFLLFLEYSFPPCVGIFPLLSFVILDLWKDIVYIWFCHGISCFLHLW